MKKKKSTAEKLPIFKWVKNVYQEFVFRIHIFAHYKKAKLKVN